MEHLADRLGFRIGLDNVAGATLGKGKSGSGLDALRWFKEGRMDLIETYCRDDVEVTRRVYEYGKANRHVKFRERNGEVRTVPVSW
jgi:DEAD/DEAH box helicase domain-containing protein